MRAAVLIGSFAGLVLGNLIFRHWLGGLLGFFAGGWVVQQIQQGLQSGGADRSFVFGRDAQQRQKVFFESVFLTMGHLAKADGRVSEDEIRAARSLMHQWGLRPEDVRVAIDLFTRGKQPDFPLHSQMERLRAACSRQPELIRAFMEILIAMPLNTGGINDAERKVLWKAAAGLGISRVEMAQFEALARARYRFGAGAQSRRDKGPDLEQAYKALGIEASASDKEVKTAYRRLMNQHHPDKLVAKGLPESMMEAAKERTREIRSAYEVIKAERKFK